MTEAAPLDRMQKIADFRTTCRFLRRSGKHAIIYGCFCLVLFAGATSADNVPAMKFEERDLAHEHGVASEEYRRTVPTLIPDSVGALPAPTSTQKVATP